MFVMYFPFMIEAGMIYKAIPPLYSIPEGKKTRYFTDQVDIIKYLQKYFLSNNSIQSLKKQPIEQKEITIFLLTNADYIYYLEKTANTYAVDPFLLEMVLYHYISNGKSIKFDKLKKEVTSAYRFMDVYNEKGTVIVRGTIDKSNLIIVSDKFLMDCNHIFDILEKNNNLYYLLNGKKYTIYQIMKVYDSARPKQLQRYKGLGEMNMEELRESTILPEQRTLIRYTMEDAKDTINTIREYESDTKKILSEVSSVTRDDLVE